MNKGIVLLVTVIFAASLILGLAPEAMAKEYKIGYVDAMRVFEEFKKTKESEKALEEKAKAKDVERKKLVDELRKLKDEQALLSDKAKAEKQVILDNKVKALQDFDRKTRDELVKERNDLLIGLQKDIEKVVTGYAKEAGYDIILNSRTLLYASEQYDLTNEILTRLNK